MGKGELIPLRFPHPACFLVLALFNSLPSVKTLHLTGCAPAVHLLAGLFGTLNAFFHKSSCRWGGPSPTEAQPPSSGLRHGLEGGAGTWEVPMAACEEDQQQGVGGRSSGLPGGFVSGWFPWQPWGGLHNSQEPAALARS